MRPWCGRASGPVGRAAGVEWLGTRRRQRLSSAQRGPAWRAASVRARALAGRGRGQRWRRSAVCRAAQLGEAAVAPRSRHEPGTNGGWQAASHWSRLGRGVASAAASGGRASRGVAGQRVAAGAGHAICWPTGRWHRGHGVACARRAGAGRRGQARAGASRDGRAAGCRLLRAPWIRTAFHSSTALGRPASGLGFRAPIVRARALDHPACPFPRPPARCFLALHSFLAGPPSPRLPAAPPAQPLASAAAPIASALLSPRCSHCRRPVLLAALPRLLAVSLSAPPSPVCHHVGATRSRRPSVPIAASLLSFHDVPLTSTVLSATRQPPPGSLLSLPLPLPLPLPPPPACC